MLLFLFSPCAPGNPIEVPSAALYIVDPKSGEIIWKHIDCHSPMEVRALSNDRFLVCDFGKARVTEIDREGKIVWETPGNNADDARRIPDGGTSIVNNGNSEIQLLDSKGQTYRIYREGLDHPAGAILTGSDTLIVADTYNRRIVELDPQGEVLRENRNVSNPLSVEPEGNGTYLIADANHHKIYRLDRNWNLAPVAEGLHHPSDAKRLPNGNLLVADTGNGRVVEIDPSGKVLRSVQFDQKPRSVDFLTDGTWIVALTFEENQVEEDRRTLEERIASGEVGELSNLGPAASFRERRRYAFALALLFGTLTIWLFFRFRGKTPHPPTGTDSAESPPAETAPLAKVEWPKFQVDLSKKTKLTIAALCYLAINAILLKVYLDHSQVDSVRVECRGSNLTLFFGEQELGAARGSKVIDEGHIGFTFWRESANDQACQKVVVRKLDSDEVLLEADFRRPETLSEWTVESGEWRTIPGVGVVNDSNRIGTLRYEKETFGDCSVEYRVRNAAELSVWVRAKGQSDFVKFTLRPERHMDTWVEAHHEGRRVQIPPTPFAKIVPPFERQVLKIVRQLLGSYFFAFVLAILGAIGFLILYPTFLGVGWILRRVPLVPKASGWGSEKFWRRLGEGTAFTIAAGLSVWMFFESKYVAEEILERMPHLQDSVSYLFQAKILAGGNLWVPSLDEPYRRFFDHEFVVNNGKWFGLYTPGAPLLFAIGLLVGKVWLVNPVLSALSVFALLVCGRSCYGTWAGLLSAVFLCSSPWVPLMSGTMISHPGSMLFTILLIWGLASGIDAKRWFPFFVAGFALGALILIRPGTSIAVGLPAIAWALAHLVSNVIRDSKTRTTISGSAAGNEKDSRLGFRGLGETETVRLFLRYCLMGSVCVAAIVFLLYYNKSLTGNAFTNTYQAYSPHLKLGFSPDVGIEWGVGHDRHKAITNLSANLKELYQYYIAPPAGSGSGYDKLIRDYFQIWLFAPLFGFLAFVDRKPISYFILAIILGIFTFYFCWFHSGISYGPRFYYALLGPITLLMARGAWMCASLVPRIGNTVGWIANSYAVIGACALISAVLLIAPAWTTSGLKERTRLIQSFRGYNGMNRRILDTIEKANLENAVVFIESDRTWIPYGNVFWSMSPRLDGPIVFARDKGLHNVPKPGNTPLDNKLLREVFPERKFYRLSGNQVIPLEAD
jgi:hypothetical protein